MKQKTTREYLFVFIFLISAGCAGLPPIVPLDHSPAPDEQSLSRELNVLFPTEPFQFVHAIELAMPGSHSAMLMGVVNIHPRHRAIHCVIMTLEGLVLFEANHTSKAFTIHRGIPPFDSQSLARGLISDIELIFFSPRGRLDAWGKLKNKNTILRFSEADSKTIDIIISPDRSIWTQNLRTHNYRIKRSIKYVFPHPPTATNNQISVFPKSITLTAAFPSRYTLTMTLTDANLIPDTQPLR
ncbi:hypothetical protein DO021_21775 [Desulfobacter hydrogenophilus]|uniref:DUF4292 domain-containing protein n=1 Tax=Desulfobacter hydrogenophilus TaxID=2291 RepID=A0A328FA74_9BACT|nr:hypothetical protein [Desulfobacter hydrogenophilus]NDY74508.1 hypothetical protein [Desulfobacter hydrogenophilus]QBH13363.1 hypothetical protein EYB58_10785 [Desulfobacter hydrogenophilus]RAL99936.1 hypothetical protein DO021_21775 [Desulfobacter hydrogenophilus]